MKLKIRVQVYGPKGGVYTYYSTTMEGEEALGLREVVNTIDETNVLSFPSSWGQVFFNRPMLDRSIVSCQVWDEDEID